MAAELQIALPLTLGDARVLTLRGGGGLPVTLGELRGKSNSPQVTANPLAVGGEGYSDGIHPVTVGSGQVTSTVIGGLAPYTLVWELVSGDAVTVIGADPLLVSWRKAFPAAGGSSFSTYRLKATDANNQIGYSLNVTVALTGYEGS